MADAERFAERLRGARVALGLEQADLEKLFEEEGYAKRMVGQLERAEVETIRGIHRAAASKTLGFPEAWFTADDPRALLRVPPPTEKLDEILRRLKQLGVLVEVTDQEELEQELESAAQQSESTASNSAGSTPASGKK